MGQVSYRKQKLKSADLAGSPGFTKVCFCLQVQTRVLSFLVFSGQSRTRRIIFPWQTISTVRTHALTLVTRRTEDSKYTETTLSWYTRPRQASGRTDLFCKCRDLVQTHQAREARQELRREKQTSPSTSHTQGARCQILHNRAIPFPHFCLHPPLAFIRRVPASVRWVHLSPSLQ